MIRHQDPCEHLRITEQGLAFETRGGYTGGGKVHEEWNAAPSRNRQVVDLMRKRYAAATQGTMSGERIHAALIGRERGEIGTATCRERGDQYVKNQGVS